MIRLFLVLLFMNPLLNLKAENPSVNYIAQYKEIAIIEMQRTGIPASIKMAQALLESGAGKSTLAREANNHFGIKCGGSWEGDTFFREDDDYHKGKLIKSCFRKFDSVHDSYMAHSDFLTTQQRYSFLFAIPNHDYKAWAKGLRKAGYATDKSYSQKLIDLIEKYELYKLDQLNSYEGDILLAELDENKAETGTEIKTDSKDVLKEERRRTDGQQKRKSSRYSPAYLESVETHRVEVGQTISEIASIYDLEENALRLRNRLPKDAEPLAGEKIHLRKKISLLKRPKFERISDQSIAAVDSEFIF